MLADLRFEQNHGEYKQEEDDANVAIETFDWKLMVKRDAGEICLTQPHPQAIFYVDLLLGFLRFISPWQITTQEGAVASD
jgi:hypothetical protein